MERPSAVFIPHPTGGNCVYEVAASSSFEAARRAIAEQEKHHPRLSDNVVVHVVVGGKGPTAFDYLEHNARQPNYRHPVGLVRRPPPARDREDSSPSECLPVLDCRPSRGSLLGIWGRKGGKSFGALRETRAVTHRQCAAPSR